MAMASVGDSIVDHQLKAHILGLLLAKTDIFAFFPDP